MSAAVLKEIESLRRLTVGGLREKYREVFGEDSRSNHKDFLFRRIAWRIYGMDRFNDLVWKTLEERLAERTRQVGQPAKPPTSSRPLRRIRARFI